MNHIVKIYQTYYILCYFLVVIKHSGTKSKQWLEDFYSLTVMCFIMWFCSMTDHIYDSDPLRL